jgi:hypothetical protein
VPVVWPDNSCSPTGTYQRVTQHHDNTARTQPTLLQPRHASAAPLLGAPADHAPAGYSWFAAVPFDDFDCARPQNFCPAYVHDTTCVHKTHLASLMRFRLGAHGLRISIDRWEQAGRASLPRQHRVCCRCTSGTEEDVFHIMWCLSVMLMSLFGSVFGACLWTLVMRLPYG